jgi:excisionase family DNA binding protein
MANGARPGQESDRVKPAHLGLVEDGCLDVPAAAEFSGMGRSWLYEQMQAGTLVYLKCGRRRLIPRRALQELLAASLVTGP